VRKKITISAIIIIITAAGFFVMVRLYSIGVFYQPENVFSGQCKTITGIAGPEDIQLENSVFTLPTTDDHGISL